MSSLLVGRRRAEAFADAVDGRSRAEDLAPELAELVAVTSALRDRVPAAPRPEFTASLRDRLMAEAATALATDARLALPPRRKGSRERRMAVAASALVLVGGTAGMAAAAQDALPGDALYPLKRGIEHARTDLALGQDAKGHQLLGQARDRLGEVQGLVTEEGVGSSPQLAATLEDFSTAAQRGAELLLESYAQERDEAGVADVREFAASALDTLRDLSATAPATAHAQLAEAASLLQRLDERAAALCSDCSDLPRLKLPSALVTSLDVERSIERAGSAPLDNSHPVPSAPADAPKASESPAQQGGKTPSDTAPAEQAAGSEEPEGSGDPLLPVPSGKPGGKPGTGVGETLVETTDGLLQGTGETVDQLLDPLLP